MATPSKITINAKTVRALPPAERDGVLWDEKLPGFGLRRRRSGSSSYIVQARDPQGVERKVTIGSVKKVPPDMARKVASEKLAAIALGQDVSPKRASHDVTLNEVIDGFVRDRLPQQAPSNQSITEGRLRHYVRPALGDRPVASIARSDVERMMREIVEGKFDKTEKARKFGVTKVRGGTGSANSAFTLLRVLLSYACELGHIDRNPAFGIKKYPERRIVRHFSPDEAARFGRALQTLKSRGANPVGLALIEFLTLSGFRRGEAESLAWDAIDFDRNIISLDRTKTGVSHRSIGEPALAILRSQLRTRRGPFVFPGTDPEKPYQGIRKLFLAVLREADIADFRIHDLRHNYASQSLAAGTSQALTGKLLGHRHSATTDRYTHLATGVGSEAANLAAQQTRKSMFGDEG